MTCNETIKQRLKDVWLRPENQVCSDCSDKKPTWASLIVPPEDAHPESQIIGAFCCFQCSGIHRSLGTHICFVRSVTLDDWKEKEVMAMEIGGNDKVNAIFEAVNVGEHKPNHLVDVETRKQFILAKYVERKFFNAYYYEKMLRDAAAAQERGIRGRPKLSREASMPTIISPRMVQEDKKAIMCAELHHSFNHSFSANWDQFKEPTSASAGADNKIKPSMVAAGRGRGRGTRSRSRGANERPRSSSRTSRSKSRARRGRSKGKRRPNTRSPLPDEVNKGKENMEKPVQCDDDSRDSISEPSLGDQPSSSKSASTATTAASSNAEVYQKVVQSSSRYSRKGVRRRTKSVAESMSNLHQSLADFRFDHNQNDDQDDEIMKPSEQLDEVENADASKSTNSSRSKEPSDISASEHGGRPRFRRQASERIRGNKRLSRSSHGDDDIQSVVSGEGASKDKRSDLSLSEHVGGRPRMRRQVSERFRCHQRLRAQSEDHGDADINSTTSGKQDDDDEEEMVHVVQNAGSVVSEPIPGMKKSDRGASLFSDHRSRMRRQTTDRSRNRSRSGSSDHAPTAADDSGSAAAPSRGVSRTRSGDGRPALRRVASIRSRNERVRGSSLDPKTRLKRTKSEEYEENNTNERPPAGPRRLKSLDNLKVSSHRGGEEHQETKRETRPAPRRRKSLDNTNLLAPDLDKSDDDEKSVKSNGGRRNGMNADRKARSRDRVRSRERRRASRAVTAPTDEPVEEPEETKPKSFDFATRRKTRPRSFDKGASRSRRSGRSGSTTASRGSNGSRDSRRQPEVTNVTKGQLGQSNHSTDGSTDGSFGFTDEEAELFGEERVSRRSIAMNNSFGSMNSSLDSIRSFEDSTAFEKDPVLVPVDS
eukprot:CAMPEP_0117077480 /NCGR_PEP_ID=MMETSP0472-20121206/54639_1 /TAXON_ID=693140 ORGANISM="Tiarina fusus, Strain LIS" /NCGR_SAMPLE_ID=MMETSP0472 /ASSEMBLY_ACC=CAM_ASM_000603 /LENGTH=876 /DNA_ID=CAMNT_0004803849 /DNA_START=90 /DNA_END=2720 /DNA_ORIENTATION=+